MDMRDVHIEIHEILEELCAIRRLLEREAFERKTNVSYSVTVGPTPEETRLQLDNETAGSWRGLCD